MFACVPYASFIDLQIIGLLTLIKPASLPGMVPSSRWKNINVLKSVQKQFFLNRKKLVAILHLRTQVYIHSYVVRADWRLTGVGRALWTRMLNDNPDCVLVLNTGLLVDCFINFFIIKSIS
jgi:N-acetylglutamate synthase-like GNAT family acetyltransferase